MESANKRIVSRLGQDISRFRSGEMDIAEIQSAVLAHGHAIEAADRAWHDLVDNIEGNIELIRVTLNDVDQKEKVLEVLGQLLQVAEKHVVDGSHADRS